MKIVFKILLIFFSFQNLVWASELSPIWFSKEENNQVVLHIELYLSTTCPHCKKADVFFQKIEKEFPYLQVQRYFINQDQKALFRFNQLLSKQQQNDFAVPSIYICDSRWVGFASAQTTGKELLHAIKYCKKQVEKNGKLTPVTVETLRHWASANRFTSGLINSPSGFNYLFSAVILDSLSSCAYFCFAGFLAFLMIEQHRKKQIISSLLFILAVFIVHYVQQVFTSSFFQLVSWFRIPAALVGIMSIYFVIIRIKKRPTNELFLYSLAFLLGLVIFLYQQTCLMNWSTIFEQWLSTQQISNVSANIYQLIYQILYITPLILTLFIYLFLVKRKRFVTLKTKFINIGLLFILAIGLSLIFYPYILSNLIVSILTLFSLFVLGLFINLT